MPDDAMLTFDLVGIEALEDILTNLPQELAANDLEYALRKGANIIKAEAAALAPRNTGGLEEGIKVKKGQPDGQSSARMLITTGAKQWYAHFAEWGTVREAAHPFMRPAVDNKAAEAIAAFADALGKRLPNTVKKLVSGAALKKYNKKLFR